MMQFSGKSTQLSFFLKKSHLKSLFAKSQRGIHTSHTASDDQGLFIDRNHFFFELLQGCRPGYGHPDKILGLLRSDRRGF